MADSYAAEYPSDVAIDPQIVLFFEQFYKTTDINTPEAHEQYVNNFTKDAIFVMAAKTVRGHEEILAARCGMWTNVSKRLHRPIRIFPFGPDASELMLYGVVAYELHDGRQTEVDWAARARLVKEEEDEEQGGRWRLALYQVYLDPTAWQNAK